MTDDTGMLQHAIFTVPNYREGYTTDDNARALMVSALLEEMGTASARFATRYLAFIAYAFNQKRGASATSWPTTSLARRCRVR